MDQENSRNTIAFAVIAMLMLLAYNMFVLEPAQKRHMQEVARQRTAAAQVAAMPEPPKVATREEALKTTPRVAIDTPALKGSISLRGARIDDLYLEQYPVTTAKGSPKVELFRPEGAQQAYFAEFGWSGAANAPDLRQPLDEDRRRRAQPRQAGYAHL